MQNSAVGRGENQVKFWKFNSEDKEMSYSRKCLSTSSPNAEESRLQSEFNLAEDFAQIPRSLPGSFKASS